MKHKLVRLHETLSKLNAWVIAPFVTLWVINLHFFPTEMTCVTRNEAGKLIESPLLATVCSNIITDLPERDIELSEDVATSRQLSEIKDTIHELLVFKSGYSGFDSKAKVQYSTPLSLYLIFIILLLLLQFKKDFCFNRLTIRYKLDDYFSKLSNMIKLDDFDTYFVTTSLKSSVKGFNEIGQKLLEAELTSFMCGIFQYMIVAKYFLFVKYSGLSKTSDEALVTSVVHRKDIGFYSLTDGLYSSDIAFPRFLNCSFSVGNDEEYYEDDLESESYPEEHFQTVCINDNSGRNELFFRLLFYWTSLTVVLLVLRSFQLIYCCCAYYWKEWRRRINKFSTAIHSDMGLSTRMRSKIYQTNYTTVLEYPMLALVYRKLQQKGIDERVLNAMTDVYGFSDSMY